MNAPTGRNQNRFIRLYCNHILWKAMFCFVCLLMSRASKLMLFENLSNSLENSKLIHKNQLMNFLEIHNCHCLCLPLVFIEQTTWMFIIELEELPCCILLAKLMLQISRNWRWTNAKAGTNRYLSLGKTLTCEFTKHRRHLVRRLLTIVSSRLLML